MHFDLERTFSEVIKTWHEHATFTLGPPLSLQKKPFSPAKWLSKTRMAFTAGLKDLSVKCHAVRIS